MIVARSTVFSARWARVPETRMETRMRKLVSDGWRDRGVFSGKNRTSSLHREKQEASSLRPNRFWLVSETQEPQNPVRTDREGGSPDVLHDFCSSASLQTSPTRREEGLRRFYRTESRWNRVKRSRGTVQDPPE